MFFAIALLLFLVKITENICMACFLWHLKITKNKAKRVSLNLPGIELLLILILVASSFSVDCHLWLTEPFTVLWLSSAITVCSYLLILSVGFFGHTSKKSSLKG